MRVTDTLIKELRSALPGLELLPVQNIAQALRLLVREK